MFNIEQFLDLSKYVTDVRAERRKQGKGTSAEFFTPFSIVQRICDKIPDDDGCFLFQLCQKIVYF